MKITGGDSIEQVVSCTIYIVLILQVYILYNKVFKMSRAGCQSRVSAGQQAPRNRQDLVPQAFDLASFMNQ